MRGDKVGRHFSNTLVWLLVAYGFLASVLPVWILLSPRDYLSTFLKIGTIVLLAVAILPWVLRGSNNLWVTLTCFVLGVTILVAIFPRRTPSRRSPSKTLTGSASTQPV